MVYGIKIGVSYTYNGSFTQASFCSIAHWSFGKNWLTERGESSKCCHGHVEPALSVEKEPSTKNFQNPNVCLKSHMLSLATNRAGF